MLLRKSEELTELTIEYEHLLRKIGALNKEDARIQWAVIDELAWKIQKLREEVNSLLSCCGRK